jgi:putative membrane protein
MVVNGYPHVPRILRQIGWPITVVIAVSLAVVTLERKGMLERVSVPSVTATVLGVSLSILLGFRTNSAYARWWEARTLWGAMVNSSRSIARQAMAYVGDPTTARRLVRLQIAFVHAARCALRRQEPWSDVDPFLEPPFAGSLRGQVNVPAAILMQMGREAADAAAAGQLSEWRLERIDSTLTDLSNVIGGLERIKNTPLPRQYDVYPELFIYLYCLVLPIALVDDSKLVTPVLCVLVAAAFLVVNQVGKNLEDPFENRPYDVPMSALSRTIEINLRQAMGETDVPEPPKPDRGVLW